MLARVARMPLAWVFWPHSMADHSRYQDNESYRGEWHPTTHKRQLQAMLLDAQCTKTAKRMDKPHFTDHFCREFDSALDVKRQKLRNSLHVAATWQPQATEVNPEKQVLLASRRLQSMQLQ